MGLMRGVVKQYYSSQALGARERTMNSLEALAVINQMQSDGVIGTYAVGGAVAALLYNIEAAETEDIDIFIGMEPAPGQLIVTQAPLFEYLKAKGYEMENLYVRISGWLVQFLPVEGNPLLREALANSVEKMVDGIPIRVFPAEYLAAIALDLGRGKDKIRLKQFVDAGSFQDVRFSEIIKRYNLSDKWQRFLKLTE